MRLPLGLRPFIVLILLALLFGIFQFIIISNVVGNISGKGTSSYASDDLHDYPSNTNADVKNNSLHHHHLASSSSSTDLGKINNTLRSATSPSRVPLTHGHIVIAEGTAGNQTIHHPQSRKPQIHFRTYGNEVYERAKKRIVNEAIETGWFTTSKALGPDDLSGEFRETYKDILALPRGGGYWVWKLDVIEQTMNEMNEGDFMVYLDSGSQVNAGGEKRFYEYIKMVNESQYDMICLKLHPNLVEHKWTTERILTAFNVTGNRDITSTAQYEGGTLLLQNGPHFRKWLKLVRSVLDMDPWLITDKYNEEAKQKNPLFQDSRHDQSIQSVSRKMLGCVVIHGHESKNAQPDKPFHVMRKRD